MNEEIEGIIAKLPPKDRETIWEHIENLEHSARSTALIGLMVRNFSHNIGDHVRAGLNCERN